MAVGLQPSPSHSRDEGTSRRKGEKGGRYRCCRLQVRIKVADRWEDLIPDFRGPDGGFQVHVLPTRWPGTEVVWVRRCARKFVRKRSARSLLRLGVQTPPPRVFTEPALETAPSTTSRTVPWKLVSPDGRRVSPRGRPVTLRRWDRRWDESVDHSFCPTSESPSCPSIRSLCCVVPFLHVLLPRYLWSGVGVGGWSSGTRLRPVRWDG